MGAVSGGDFAAPIAGTRIRDNDLVDELGNRLETGAEVVFLVRTISAAESFTTEVLRERTKGRRSQAD